MKVVSTDHKQAKDPTSLMVCFFKQRVFLLLLSLLYFYSLFPFIKFTLFLLLIPGTLYTSWCPANFYFNCVMYTYTYI